MINLRNYFSRPLAVAVFGVVALSASAYALSAAPVASTSAEAKQDWAKERQERLKHFTDRLANRLEIKASQQNAFQAFVKALEAAAEHPAMQPEVKTDAASLARQHADFAAAHAQKLAQIADATAKLQEVLNPEQRKTLDQIAARIAHRGERRGHGDQEHGRWNRHEQGGVEQKHDNEQH
ncbi:MAG: Spy/CpxP family protein refolding chaperone [Burkholderiaceae bacterium]|nr:Spy/CpxP family protein refolding chaperone [Burkholderiaceae bacterium]